jgi:ParB-like chromosome segregation protein Spo0J
MENKFQVMPPLSDEEFKALMDDIAENGVQVPVVVDDAGFIIDGFHRVRAWEQMKVFHHDLPPYKTEIASDATTEAEKRDLAWRLNMKRRHLSPEQKREMLAAKIKESTEWTDNRIAELMAVDDKTVRRVRKALETRKDIPVLEYLEGKDGKRYPRERPRETKFQRLMRQAAASEERRREKQIAEQLKDLDDDEKVREFLVVEPATEEDDKESRTIPANIKQPATALRGTPIGKKMLELDYVVGGYDKIESEAGPEAVAEAVVELLSEWIESFVPLVEAKLEDVHTDDQ